MADILFFIVLIAIGGSGIWVYKYYHKQNAQVFLNYCKDISKKYKNLTIYPGSESLEDKHDHYNIRNFRSKEVREKATIKGSFQDTEFYLAQYFDNPGQYKAGAGIVLIVYKEFDIRRPVYLLSEKTANKVISKISRNFPKRKGFTDPEFEKRFEIFAKDGVDAQYLLNPVNVESLKEIGSDSAFNHIEIVFDQKCVILYLASDLYFYKPYSLIPTGSGNPEVQEKSWNVIFRLIKWINKTY